MICHFPHTGYGGWGNLTQAGTYAGIDGGVLYRGDEAGEDSGMCVRERPLPFPSPSPFFSSPFPSPPVSFPFLPFNLPLSPSLFLSPPPFPPFLCLRSKAL